MKSVSSIIYVPTVALTVLHDLTRVIELQVTGRSCFERALH